ncbi:MAG: hypothetical protein JNL97_15960 [Verrucomicrobiales bacterium]|nr:hypothetical protein [Verrucomicrobiales bacterium]
MTDYGKTHESLLVTEALPMDIQAALLLLRGRPSGTNALTRTGLDVPREARVFPELRWKADDGTPRSIPFGRLFSITTGGADGAATGSLKSGPWVFTGSLVTQEGFGAHFEGSIVALITDPIAIVNNPGADREDDEVHVPNPETVPPVGTDVAVELRLEPVASSPTPSGASR